MIFYIHIQNGVGFLPDEEGNEFLDFDAAAHAAIHAGAEIIADELKSGCRSVELTLFIEDAAHHRMAALPIKASIGLHRS